MVLETRLDVFKLCWCAKAVEIKGGVWISFVRNFFDWVRESNFVELWESSRWLCFVLVSWVWFDSDFETDLHLFRTAGTWGWSFLIHVEGSYLRPLKLAVEFVGLLRVEARSSSNSKVAADRDVQFRDWGLKLRFVVLLGLGSPDSSRPQSTSRECLSSSPATAWFRSNIFESERKSASPELRQNFACTPKENNTRWRLFDWNRATYKIR
ncbi:hypothetical protein Drorol1_Dr00018028 [Drosera rotundifolia]